ncbi:alginate lyase family protein [Halomonas litopenaei]|uniref:alginate lyase family protein n=1 Tax=Halomonas litopenaei TaxID=2109328 RepID=UPI003FA048BB
MLNVAITLPRLARAGGLALLMGGWLPVASALTLEQRQALDLEDYRVSDPQASYFDVEARMALLEEQDNSILTQIQDSLGEGVSCRQLLQPPPITSQMRIPGFYPSPEEWREASAPLFEFEDSVSLLAGTYVATGDDYYADCLVRYLDHWASQDALTRFHYEPEEPQAWFATESMIFAAALAYSVVRPEVDGLEEPRQRVERWLEDLALEHSAIPGDAGNSCCNNHFYRRALYASTVGVLVDNDELFRFGVSAIHSALNDMTEQGAFPLEMERGRRATHYQNYALLYLITNMQVIARQGYDIFSLEVDGKTIHDAVDFTMSAIDDPGVLGDMAPSEQYRGFLTDPQYFSWMEVYQSRFDDPRIADFLEQRRPIYNRSAGGYVTLYFMAPRAQQHLELEDQSRKQQTLEALNEADGVSLIPDNGGPQ